MLRLESVQGLLFQVDDLADINQAIEQQGRPRFVLADHRLLGQSLQALPKDQVYCPVIGMCINQCWKVNNIRLHPVDHIA